MNYTTPSYAFASDAAGITMDQSLVCGPPQVAYPAMSASMESYLAAAPVSDMPEYCARVPAPEDYEGYTESLTRPRLTKEQVETLEAHFQLHPKPNSLVKRQLALQTNLSLERVAVGGPFTTQVVALDMLIRELELVPEPTGQGQATAATGGV